MNSFIRFFIKILLKIKEVHEGFLRIPCGNTIGHYLVHCFFHSPNMNFTVMKDILWSGRYERNRLPTIGVGQRDIKIAHARNNFLRDNERAYFLAWKQNPSLDDIIEFACLGHQWWSLLIAIKAYLIHHPDLEKQYNGFLPCGSPVAKYITELFTEERIGRGAFTGRTLPEQTELRDLTKMLADRYNMTTCEVNTMFYLEGLELMNTLRSNAVAPTAEAPINDSTETNAEIVRTPKTDDMFEGEEDGEAENEAN